MYCKLCMCFKTVQLYMLTPGAHSHSGQGVKIVDLNIVYINTHTHTVGRGLKGGRWSQSAGPPLATTHQLWQQGKTLRLAEDRTGYTQLESIEQHIGCCCCCCSPILSFETLISSPRRRPSLSLQMPMLLNIEIYSLEVFSASFSFSLKIERCNKRRRGKCDPQQVIFQRMHHHGADCSGGIVHSTVQVLFSLFSHFDQMSNVIECQMPNVIKCHQMYLNIKCNLMSNVIQCQM